MKTSQFTSLIENLTPSQKALLLEQLKSSIQGQKQYEVLRSEIVGNTIKCGHCSDDNVVKFGSYSGRARYRCKACNRTFTDLTGTSISCIKKKELWNSFLELMVENKSIRDIAKKLGISTKTAFEWRHKVLCSLEVIFTKKFSGIIELDDIYIPFNQKGRKKKFAKVERKAGISDNQVAVMVMMDRYGSLDMKTATRGRIDTNDLERVIPVERINNEGNIICSDSHPTLIKYFRDTQYKHYTVNVSNGEYVKEGVYHIQRVNSLVKEFRKWLGANYVSVSTKYLQNYLNLYMVLHVLKRKKGKAGELLKYSLVDSEAFDKQKRIEQEYQMKLEDWE